MGRAAAAGTGLLANVVAGVGSAIGASRTAIGESLDGGGDGTRNTSETNLRDEPLRLYRRTDEDDVGASLPTGADVAPTAVPILDCAGDSRAGLERVRPEEELLGGVAAARRAPPLPPVSRARTVMESGGKSGRISAAHGGLEGRANQARGNGIGRSTTYAAGCPESDGIAAAFSNRAYDGEAAVCSNATVTEGVEGQARAGLGLSAFGMASATGGAVLRGLWGGLQGVQSVATALQEGGEGGRSSDPIRLYRRDGDGARDGDSSG